MKNFTDDQYQAFCRFLENNTGIVLGNSKQYLVKSRLSPLMTRFGIESMGQLIERSMQLRERELKTAVIDAMTTNETLWFRDNYPFTQLSERLFPELAKPGKSLRVWSAACSSGQEPYSIAMTAQEYMSRRPGALPGLQIIATDISATMLEQCKQGIYDSLSLARGLSPERRSRFFTALDNGRMQLQPAIRNMVSFRSYNLLDSYASLGKFDIIFCRNVLIYFSPENKSKILNQFAGALNPGGYLLLGASESLTGLSDRFEMIRCSPGIIYRLR
ncbi:CheR family methyltransferase [Oceanimonas baumannii]|uniref:protein-glutamate O-methyltransferase n=1 Tax=Oceanimonas baumannii TaxID=129578 RepID=A0A235CNB3_9GAMM|nr:protein-glutamate O-methyltransferase CheR [Oceanimonas baumannii]OYD25874.1 chemotaxis protein CheR [Oceanimonas baumannii]TDW60110.1 chemotaxis protein methyltransferase CheR [Oceanimonas baumannii]